jgi:hypothetical protein
MLAIANPSRIPRDIDCELLDGKERQAADTERPYSGLWSAGFVRCGMWRSGNTDSNHLVKSPRVAALRLMQVLTQAYIYLNRLSSRCCCQK